MQRDLVGSVTIDNIGEPIIKIKIAGCIRFRCSVRDVGVVWSNGVVSRNREVRGGFRPDMHSVRFPRCWWEAAQ